MNKIGEGPGELGNGARVDSHMVHVWADEEGDEFGVYDSVVSELVGRIFGRGSEDLLLREVGHRGDGMLLRGGSRGREEERKRPCMRLHNVGRAMPS